MVHAVFIHKRCVLTRAKLSAQQFRNAFHAFYVVHDIFRASRCVITRRTLLTVVTRTGATVQRRGGGQTFFFPRTDKNKDVGVRKKQRFDVYFLFA